ncbi:MAG: VWA domain-containing protein [Planctomycetes bacterium]|nr:VWA domain-containing protein [Planctomycetota bacterium]NOG54527.1 VWA domain-containing protein [Planctomycetota bacterium]
MTFDCPWILLGLIPLIPFLVWMMRHGYAELMPWARRASITTRVILLAALLMALAEPSFIKTTRQTHILFLIDISQSISAENIETTLTRINEIAREAQSTIADPLFTTIAFGEGATIVNGPSATWHTWTESERQRLLYRTSLPALHQQRTEHISSGAAAAEVESLNATINQVERFRDEVAGLHTNIEQAARLAANCGSTDTKRTILLFTDAQFTRGSWDATWLEAAERDTTIHTFRMEQAGPPEVALTSIALPQSATVNQGFTAHLNIESTVETVAECIAYLDGYQVHAATITLSVGRNTLEIPNLYCSEKGFHAVSAVIRPESDTEIRNNTVRSLLSVPGDARILYVDGEEEHMPYLKGALEMEGMHVDARPLTGIPHSQAELLSYDAFILCDVPADRLTLRQMQMIQSYVRDFGGGFMMLGGDESFGLGGYYNTPVEETLPVRMPIQKDLIRPSLALMLVIDKSGSMDGVKIQLAKRAAIATAEAINPRDQIGLIGFDSAARTILPLTPAGDRASIAARIADLDAGGGTFMYPALRDAREQLQVSNARRKQVIVLSDGQTEGFGYEDLAALLASEGIGVSTVGIGEGADMRLLEAMAVNGGGVSYFTNDFFSIPQIFTREAMRASKNMLIERLVQPVVIEEDIVLKGMDTDSLPLLTGYVATTPRQAATTVIISDAGDPLLAHWRYGLGRAAAFTSDTKPRWAADWIRWPQFTQFWSQIVRYIAGRNLGQQLDVTTSHEQQDGQVRLVADVVNSDGEFVSDAQVTLSTINADGQAETVDVQCIAPGRYETSIPTITYGQEQTFAWRADSSDMPEPQSVPYGFVYSYSPEFQSLGPNRERLDEIASIAPGSVHALDSPDPITFETGGSARVRLWPFLLALAVIIIPADILFRRLGC